MYVLAKQLVRAMGLQPQAAITSLTWLLFEDEIMPAHVPAKSNMAIWRSSIGPRASHAARLPLAIRMPAQTQWYVALRGATALPIYRIFTAVVHARMVVRDTLAVASPASALACMPRANVGVDG